MAKLFLIQYIIINKMNTLIIKFSESTIPCIDEVLKKIDAGLWFRADGDCLCPVCNEPYKRHKNIEGIEWLTVLCNGDLVKL